MHRGPLCRLQHLLAVVKGTFSAEYSADQRAVAQVLQDEFEKLYAYAIGINKSWKNAYPTILVNSGKDACPHARGPVHARQ